MASVWAVSTNKGGVLKTSITTNLSGLLARRGKRVLIVDTDNQGNCLVSFGRDPDRVKHSLYDVLIGSVSAAEAIVEVHEGIDILPANDDMAFFEFDVLADRSKFPNPFSILRDRIGQLRGNYDYILIDTPPNLGLTQGNVLAFADAVLIPFQPESYSMRSLVKITNAIREFRDRHNSNLSILGVVATLVQKTNLHAEAMQECRKYCKDTLGIRMFETVIPRSIRFPSAIAYQRKPATLAAPNDPFIDPYQQLLQEVLQ